MPESSKETIAPTIPSQTPSRVVFPAWGDWIVLLLLLLFSAIAGARIAAWCGCSLPAAADAAVNSDTWSRAVFVLYLGQMGTMLALTLAYRRLRRGPHLIARFSARGLNPLLLLWGVAVILACGVVLEPLLQWLDFESMPLPDPGRDGWALLTAVAAAPLFEELLCRGILLESLRARSGVWAAWIGSSLFFGIIHLHPVQAVNALVLGLLFGFLCLQTRSLWPSLFLHAFNNALALLLMWAEFPGEKFDGRPMADLSVREIVGDPKLYALIYAAALAVVAVSALGICRKIARMRALERKNEACEVINPAEDTLNSGK